MESFSLFWFRKRMAEYEIVAGARRWRAAKLAGISEVPVLIREYDGQQTMEIALIENVQRTDLNPIEEALAYQRLTEEFHLTGRRMPAADLQESCDNHQQHAAS